MSNHAMRMGLSVGDTTDASSLADQVKRFKPRDFRKEGEEGWPKGLLVFVEPQGDAKYDLLPEELRRKWG